MRWGLRLSFAILGLFVLAAPAASGATPEQATFAERANRLYAQGRLPDAIAALATAVAAYPDDPQLHFMHGTALLRARDYVAACRAYERASALRWEHPDTHLNLGFARFHSGRDEEAREAWREAVRQAPADPFAHLALALGESTCGNHGAALLEIDLAAALGNPISLLDERVEVRWGLRGADAIHRLLAVWRRTPPPVFPSAEDAR